MSINTENKAPSTGSNRVYTSESGDEAFSTVGQEVQRAGAQVTNTIRSRPSSSMLIACLVGLGAGFLVTRIVGSSQDNSSFDRGSAERFGRNLLSKLERSLPDSLRERFGA